jgi:ferritin-like metal-binding protein YciE
MARNLSSKDSMKKRVNSPADLVFDQLRDLYSMEEQINRHLPELVEMTTDETLRAHLIAHSQETGAQLDILLDLFRRHDETPGNDASKAIAGLIEGGSSHLEGVEDPSTRDLMVIAHCLRLEHYEIAAYDITSRLAGQLGWPEEAGILLGSLEQERAAAEGLLPLQPTVFEAANQ